jgi:PAS domain S-box-containing protein
VADRPDHPARLLGLAAAVAGALFVADVALGARLGLAGAYVLVPLALVVAGASRGMAAGGAAVASALALASGAWNGDFASADHIATTVAVAVAGGLAVLAARRREQQQAATRAVHAAAERLGLVEGIGRVAQETLSVEAVAGRLADILTPAFADLCTIDTFDEARRPSRVAVRCSAPGGAAVERTVARLEPDAGRVAGLAAAIDTKQAVLVDGTAPQIADPHEEADTRLIAALALRSSVVVPLVAAGRAVGLLGLAVGPSGRRYEEDDLAFARILAGRAALAISNARLLEELTATREQLDRTLGTLAEAVTVIDRSGQMRYANPAAAELLGYPSAEALLAEPPGGVFARWSATLEDGRPLTREDVPSWRVLHGESAEPLLTRVVHRDTGVERWRLVKASAFRGPDGEPLAVSVIEDVTDAKEAEIRQRFLARAGEVLAASLDYEDTMQRIAALAVPQLADWCGVDVLDERGRARQVAVAHVDPDKVAFGRLLRERYPPDPADSSGLYGVLRGGEAQLHAHISDDMLAAAISDPAQLEMTRAIGMRSAMIVPMRVASGRTIGAISFVAAESGRAFGADDLDFAEELARRAAVAVDNARLYRLRDHAAETLQRSLLPARLPDVPGWQFADSYRPGDREADVGGDFYDIIDLDDAILVFIGDVTGKGVEAAALTALARHTLATAARFDPAPSAVLALLNDVLCAQPASALVTCACARLPPSGGERGIEVALAGHPAPLRLRPGEPAVPVGTPQPLLGIAAGRTWETNTAALTPGDTLLFYTDGVTDTPGPGERFGDRRLRQSVADAPTDPAALVAHVEATLLSWQRSDVVDDRALLALNYLGAPLSRSAAKTAAGKSQR